MRLITLNLEFDGGPDEGGRLPERWRVAHEELLAPRRPDVLLRQEMTHSRADGRSRLHAAERALGMRGFLDPQGNGQNPTGLFLRPGTFQMHHEYAHAGPWRTSPTNIIAQLDGAPGRGIVMCSWHAVATSPRGREREADALAALAGNTSRGRHFIGGGDNNEYPLPDGETVPPIDWSDPAITDLPHRHHRTNRAPDGTYTSCTYLDHALLECGLHDPARHAHHVLEQPHALDATAGHAAPEQGGPSRIDRIYLDPWLIQAVLEVHVIDTTGISDHHAVEVVLSHTKAVEMLHRRLDPLPPLPIAT